MKRTVFVCIAGLFLICPSPVIRALSSSDIIQHVEKKYESIENYSAIGKTVSIVDMSAMKGSLPGTSPSLKDSNEFKEAMSKPQTLVHTFRVKLGKPNYYRIEWEQWVENIPLSKGAVWSTGEGDFLMIGTDKYSKMDSQEIALEAATGVSGGAAGTVPFIFFKSPASILKNLKGVSQQMDERVENEECYVLAGTVAEQKVKLWITKQNFLIKQKQHTLGQPLLPADLSDASIKLTLKQLHKEPTAAAIAEMKTIMKNAREMASTIKGSLTETYQNIVLNVPEAKSNYEYKVPAGAKQAPSPF